MGFFSNQLSNVVEWQEYRDDLVFYKWNNDEIKKGSRLILRQGQDAIFMYNGQVEGIFQQDGSYDIESDIIPFLSSLAGFKFGFNSGLRAEVLFVNTREFVLKWGTKNAINLQAPGLPGGMPVRAYGTFNFKVADYLQLIENVAGVKNTYTSEEVRSFVIAKVDSLLMKWIAKEAKDMFNLQANSYDISQGIVKDLEPEFEKRGLAITDFTIQSVSYPEEVRRMQEKAAGQSMIGDMNRYSQVAMADSMGKTGGSSTASDMAGMMMGMQVGAQMLGQMGLTGQQPAQPVQQAAPVQGNGTVPNFCPNCGAKTNGANFCGNCGTKLC